MQFFFLHLLSISVQYLWKSDFAFTITDKTKSRLVRDVNLHDVYNLRTFDDTGLYAFLQLFKNACIKKLMHQKVVWNLLSDKFLLIYLLWIMLSLFKITMYAWMISWWIETIDTWRLHGLHGLHGQLAHLHCSSDVQKFDPFGISSIQVIFVKMNSSTSA